MRNRKGITMTILAISIAVMLIILTSSVIVGSSYIGEAKLDSFKTMLAVVSDNVNLYILENNTLPTLDSNDAVVYNNYGSDFVDEVTLKKDTKNKLYVIDVTKLKGLVNIKEGKGSISSKDVFVVAENTNNVYYLKGCKYKNKVHFGI